MLQIRHGVFETNSSSTHSITMCSKDDYDRWVDGEVYLNDGWWSKDNESEYKNNKFITRDEVKDILNHDKYFDGNFARLSDEDLALEYEIYSFDTYDINDCLEHFEDSYTTDLGETVVAFGYFGFDY